MAIDFIVSLLKKRKIIEMDILDLHAIILDRIDKFVKRDYADVGDDSRVV